MDTVPDVPPKIGYLGPPGTFSEEALLTQPDYAVAELIPMDSMHQILTSVDRGELELGFLPLENSIEGTVNLTLDGLIFDFDLLIQREVILDVHLDLMAYPGTRVEEVKSVLSYPHATAQCRGFLRKVLPHAELIAANSTADAARIVGEEKDKGMVALAPSLASKLYGLEILASCVEDHSDDQTRFVSLARSGIPEPTGHDRTSIVCFQKTDRPGSLHAILGQFAARGINLTKIESRPTKRGLGNYCFAIDLEGHIEDEIVADCLRDLHVMLESIKFLGSYPAASGGGDQRRREVRSAWQAADAWVGSLRRTVGTSSQHG